VPKPTNVTALGRLEPQGEVIRIAAPESGSRAKVKLIGRVESYRFAIRGNETVNYGIFRRQITGGENFDEKIYVLANCKKGKVTILSQKPIFGSQGIVFSQVDRERTWMTVNGNDSDYTTVAGGRGYYFDALCRNPVSYTPKD
jgi:hypothetical protein